MVPALATEEFATLPRTIYSVVALVATTLPRPVSGQEESTPSDTVAPSVRPGSVLLEIAA